MSKVLYLAGPMSGIPAFNFPAFIAAAAALRAAGWTIVSPAETDPEDVRQAALASPDGAYGADGRVASETWGDMLARDVKQLADGALFPTLGVFKDAHGDDTTAPVLVPIDGIVFLPNWENSKGARLEAFVGLLAKKQFFTYDSSGPDAAVEVTPAYVKASLAMAWAEDIARDEGFSEALRMYTPI